MTASQPPRIRRRHSSRPALPAGAQAVRRVLGGDGARGALAYAGGAGASTEAAAEARLRSFPGRVQVASAGLLASFIAHGLSLLLHGTGIGVLLAVAALAPDEVVETLIPVTRLPESAAPVAARPRVLAEARRFASAVAAPRVVKSAAQLASELVVQPRRVEAVKLRAENIEQQKPQQRVARANVGALLPTEVTPVAAPSLQPVEFDIATPVLRETARPRKSVGPRATPEASGEPGAAALVAQVGAAVRGEALPSSRDVFGSTRGSVRAEVNWRFGADNTRGGVGDGAPPAPCVARPAVGEYVEEMERRVNARWESSQASREHVVEVSFRITPQGEVRQPRMVQVNDPRVGAAALRALQSASPFPTVPAGAHCLLNGEITLELD